VAAELLARADLLAACSEDEGRLTRRFATPALAEAGELVSGWMSDAGMTVRTDAIGNVIGRYEAREDGAPALLLGSHLDTVPDAGRYDGPLGVLAGIAVAERLQGAGRRLPFALEVVGFADEEGARFGTAFLGSSVMAGSFDVANLDRRDTGGVTLEEAIRAAGGDVAGLGEARREPGELVGYAELHIEQGPVLEELGQPVGVVTGIAGQTRIEVRVAGAAGHAGTVPMELRRDALPAAAEIVLAAEGAARETPGLVATVGRLIPLPGAPNVIPGAVELTLDVRHSDDGAREDALARLRETAEGVARERGVDLDWTVLHSQPAVRCDPRLTELMARAAGSAGAQATSLTSGAGHDAAIVAQVAPVAMLFVRCAGGVSHHPAEAVSEGDVQVALDTLARFVDEVAEGAP
jgi:allantoate deiminase